MPYVKIVSGRMYKSGITLGATLNLTNANKCQPKYPYKCQPITNFFCCQEKTHKYWCNLIMTLMQQLKLLLLGHHYNNKHNPHQFEIKRPLYKHSYVVLEI